MDNFLIVFGAILLIAGLIVLGPLLTIWALNTLFHLGILFTFKNWVAMFLLNGITIGLPKYLHSGKSKKS